jgi:hypothetical protein
MRRLMVVCACGERIQVPRSALGKTGLCPACGRTLEVTNDNAVPIQTRGPVPTARASSAQSGQWSTGHGQRPVDDTKRKFAEAVDLYFAHRYAEALTIFTTLATLHPDNPDIEMGRSMCVSALRTAPDRSLESRRHAGELPAPDSIVHGEDRLPRRKTELLSGPIPPLDLDVFQRFLVDKMMHGESDEIQLRAAELAAKMFGFLDGNGATRLRTPPAPTPPPESHEVEATDQTPAPEGIPDEPC